MTKPNRAAVNVPEWDQLDPVANAVLGLIGTQYAVAIAIAATGEARGDGTFGTEAEAEVEAAFDARTDAIMELLAAIDRDSGGAMEMFRARRAERCLNVAA